MISVNSSFFTDRIILNRPIVVSDGIVYDSGLIVNKIQEYKSLFESLPFKSLIHFPDIVNIDFICALIATLESGHIYTPYSFPKGYVDFLLKDRMAKEKKIKFNVGSYIIPTSGSEGVSKWILGNLEGLIDYLECYSSYLNLSRTDRFGLLTRPIFDPFFREVFLPLIIGGKLVIPEYKNLILEQKMLVDWISREEITVLQVVPTVLRMAFSQNLINNSVNTLLLAGEPVYGSDIEGSYNLFSGLKRVYNIYGPSETTLSKLIYEVNNENRSFLKENDPVPIGKPICSSKVLILNEENEPCRPYENGEIVIRYKYPSHGYLKINDLDGQLDIINPFSSNPYNPNDKLSVYFTGDLAFNNSNNEMVFVSRKGMEVKIRGVKISLSKIENIIRTILGVDECAVKKYSDENKIDKIALFYVGDIPEDELANKLRALLSDIEMPNYIDKIITMPLTISNKINRSILNVKVEGKSESYYSDNFFIAIKEIFYDVLPMMRKIKSSSFLQLGGQSIDAVQIVYRINRKFNVNLRLCDFFQLDSIDSISNFISTLDKVNQTDIYSNARNHVDGKGIPLLGSQKRFIDWILKYHRNDSSKFLFTCIFELSGELNSKKLIDAIVRTVVNNFALNTRLKEDLSGLEEITDKEFDVRYVDLQNNCIDGVINELGTEFIDVFKERPIKFYLIKENGEKHYLIMRNHIVCSDGTTKVNILSAISSFYNNSDFSLNCRYKDYVSEEISHRPEWPKLLNYWKSLTANISKPELKKLPLNIPECVDTGVLTHVFSESAISMVNCLCGDLKVSISSVILHAIEAALSKIEELTLSYIIISNAKRFSPESKSVVGCLTDSYIYPLNYNESKSIKEVHRKNLELIENSQPSFQYITSSLLNEIDFCISSECPIIYSPQPIFGDSINLNNIELYELTGKPMWIWPIEIYPNISNSSIVININYAKCPDAEFIASRVFSHIKATFN